MGSVGALRPVDNFVDAAGRCAFQAEQNVRPAGNPKVCAWDKVLIDNKRLAGIGMKAGGHFREYFPLKGKLNTLCISLQIPSVP